MGVIERARFVMAHGFDDSWRYGQIGEAFLVGGVDSLLSGWRAPAADVIGRLCTGGERWQAAIRQNQAPVNLADILRSRPLIQAGRKPSLAS
jgi:hypothetical protein